MVATAPQPLGQKNSSGANSRSPRDSHRHQYSQRKTSNIFVASAGIFLAANLCAGLSQQGAKRSLLQIVATDRYSASITGKPESWWMSKDFLENKHDLVLLGSSQLQCFYTADASDSQQDIDQILDHRVRVLESALAKYGVRATSFNASLAGSMFSDRVLVQKTLFPYDYPKTVVLGISPRDLYDNLLPSVSSTEPFAFFAPLVSDRNFPSDTFGNAWERIGWHMANKLPLRAGIMTTTTQVGEFIQAWLDKLPQTNSRATSLVQSNKPFFFGTDTTFSITPGKCLIPHQPFEGFINNNHEYQERYKHWTPDDFKPQLEYLDQSLQDLAEHNAKVALIGMPLDAMNRDLLKQELWTEYDKQVRAICQKHDIVFYDLSRADLFDHNDFADGVHLNYRGAHKLADILAKLIAVRS